MSAANLATAALRYVRQGEPVDAALAHACRRVPAAPAPIGLARALVLAQLDTEIAYAHGRAAYALGLPLADVRGSAADVAGWAASGWRDAQEEHAGRHRIPLPHHHHPEERMNPATLPRTLFWRVDRRADLPTCHPDPEVRLVVAQLLAVPWATLAQLWREDMPANWSGPGDALVALAERTLAPLREAHRVLVQQHGCHQDARAQLQQVLALREPGTAPDPVLVQAIRHLDDLQVRQTALVLEQLGVHRG